MRLPKWLYESRTERDGMRTRRWGSRRYGLVVQWIGGDPYLSDSLMGTVWRFHFGLGPSGGIHAGFADAGIRGRLWYLGRGRALGLGYRGGAVR